MSPSPAQPDATETDDLVAYLDGELSADDCRRVERRLANDADYRRRLTDLERAWTALDSLPATTVDDDFARTTIEMVCVAADNDLQQNAATRSTAARQRRLWMVVGGALIAVVAFAATWWLAPSRDHILVADLPVVARLDVLSDVGNVEYLRGLTRFNFDTPTRNAMNDVAVVNPEEWNTLDERRVWIEALPAGERAELAGRLERYRRESPETRDHLLELAREIEVAGDRDELESTLSAYGAWLQTRTPAERAGLRSLSVDERLQRVERLVEQSQRSSRRQLSPSDEEALQAAILSLVEQRRHELANGSSERGEGDRQEQLANRSTAFLALRIIGRDMLDDLRREQLENRLTAPLSEEAQSYLDRLEGRQRQRQLGRWVFEALTPKIGPQNLQEFFVNRLTDDQREYLLGLPRADMDDQLRQMYARSRVGLHDDDVPREFGWGRPGERRGGRDGRGPRDRDGQRPRGEFEGDRFDGPPGRRRPNGDSRPDRPPGPPPRARDWRPPPDEERPFRPPPPE
jgi:hypothetical protein